MSAGIRPSEAFPSLPCVQLAVNAVGCGARWDTPLGGLPALACVQLAVFRWGVLPPPPTHSPTLRPPRLHFLQLCHLVIQSTRTTPFCRPNTRPRKCTSRYTRWDTSLGVLPVLACVLLAVPARGGFSLSPHTHPPLDLLGCIFCNSVTPTRPCDLVRERGCRGWYAGGGVL